MRVGICSTCKRVPIDTAHQKKHLEYSHSRRCPRYICTQTGTASLWWRLAPEPSRSAGRCWLPPWWQRQLLRADMWQACHTDRRRCKSNRSGQHRIAAHRVRRRSDAASEGVGPAGVGGSGVGGGVGASVKSAICSPPESSTRKTLPHSKSGPSNRQSLRVRQRTHEHLRFDVFGAIHANSATTHIASVQLVVRGEFFMYRQLLPVRLFWLASPHVRP